MKTIKIAYSHNPNDNDYIVFKKVLNQDHELHTCETAEQAGQWIEDNFITLRADIDYNLCLPLKNTKEKR